MFNKILVAVDVPAQNDAAKLCKTAAKLGAEQVRLVSVVADYGTPLVASFFPDDAQDGLKSEMLSLLSNLAEKHLGDVQASYCLRQGKRAKEVLAEAAAWEPDLIIVGCRRKNSSSGHKSLGSCSSSVADRAAAAVLIVK